MAALLGFATIGTAILPISGHLDDAVMPQAWRDWAKAAGLTLPHDYSENSDRENLRRLYETARWLDQTLRTVAAQAARPVQDREQFSLPERPRTVGIKPDGHLEAAEPNVNDWHGWLAGILEQELFSRDLTRLRQCEVCMLLFWAVQKRSRCCSPRCNNVLKQREHFRRRQQAQELRDQGKSLRQISQELHASIESVKRWLGDGDKGSEKSKTQRG